MSKSELASDLSLLDFLDEDLLTRLAGSLSQAWGAQLGLYDKEGALAWGSHDSTAEAILANGLAEQPWLESLARALTHEPGTTGKAVGACHEAAMASLQCEHQWVGTLVGMRCTQDMQPDGLAAIEAIIGSYSDLLSKLLDANRASDDLAEELLNRYEELALVHEVSQALHMDEDLSSTLDRVFAPLCKAFAADKLLFAVPYLGLSKQVPEEGLFEEGSNQLLQSLWRNTKDETGCVLNFMADNAALSASAGDMNHALVLPLHVDGSPGRLVLLRTAPHNRFFSGDLRLLSSIGNHLSSCVSNARVTFYRKELLHSSLLGLSKLAEFRDEDTGEHLQRVSLYCKTLSEQLLAMDRYTEELTPEFMESLFRTSPLHDIGKVGVADAILLKPGKLTPEEFEEMKKHAAIGGDTLHEVGERMRGNGGYFLEIAQQIAYSHHEKWDGSGYPKGLAGTSIPLAARIMALADVYDALTSERCYKKAFDSEKAREILVEGSGTHFDSTIVDAFVAIEDLFTEIRTANVKVL